MSPTRRLFLGIDVGTGSARAGLFDARGGMLGMGVTPITTWRPRADFVEQSSNNIWSAVCRSVRAAMKQARAAARDVAGIGFDATCSLVVLDEEERPLSVSPSGKAEQNIIVWMDHRAVAQAERINATKHPVLRFVGGRISPEMEPPKILWLKEHLPQTFAKARYFFDLPDWLTFRATDDATRSLCTTVCKWTYQGHAKTPAGSDSVGSWDAGFWRRIGLGELADNRFARIGSRVRPMGEPLGAGLTERAAKELGLRAGTAVSVAIIDAHAGGLGLLGIREGKRAVTPAELETRVALIAGTSSCHMAASRKPLYIPGIWGPYFSAMIPSLWLTEGGQSASGALLDHIVYSHARSADLVKEAARRKTTVYALIEDRLRALAKERGLAFTAELARDRHVLPDFHGNRSPLADPHLRGIVTGLALENTVDELALQYLAALQGVAHGTRHIIEAMNDKGYRISTILATGGGAKSPFYLQEHADATGCRILLGKERESVLLGSAILGAVAAGVYTDILDGMQAMSRPGDIVKPAGRRVTAFHDRKYKALHELYKTHSALKRIMHPGE